MSPFWGCAGTRLLSAQEPERQRDRESLSMTSIKRKMSRGFSGLQFQSQRPAFPLISTVSGLGLLRTWGSLINQGFTSLLSFLSSHLLSCVNCKDSQTVCKGSCLPSFFFTPMSLKQRNTELNRVLLTSYLALFLPFSNLFPLLSLFLFVFPPSYLC